MKRTSLLLVFALVALPAFASGTEVPAFALDGGAIVLEAPPPMAPAPALDNPMPFLQVIFTAVKDGNWWAAASALLVLIVSLIRLYGKKLHDKIPDDSAWDKPFWFIFDTKAGGYLLNMSTAVAGGVGTAILAHEPITWALVKPILMVSVTGTALWEIAKDVWGMVKKKAVPPPEPPKP